MGMIYTIIGIAIATVLAGIGSAKGVGAAAQASMGVLSEDSSMFGKMLVLTLLPGTQGLYGFIVAFLMLLGASLSVGIGGLVSGIAQGKAAVAGISMCAKDEKNFSKAMVSITLVEIYALLAFIVSLLTVISIPNIKF